MIELAPGQNVLLPDGPIVVTASGPVDLSALVVGDNGKVSGDADFVFFNAPATPGTRLDNGRVTIDPDRLRRGAAKVVIVASPADQRSTFGGLPVPTVTAADTTGTPFARFSPLRLTTETALLLVEIYCRGGRWKLRAVGQGYASGLAGLATDFGVRVDDDGNAREAGPAPSPGHGPGRRAGREPEPPKPATFANTSPAAPALPALGSVRLDKGAAATIPLIKNSNTIVTASLVWDGGSNARISRGADLDIYALYVPDGEVDRKKARTTKGVVYYRDMGSVDKPPFIQLDGDSKAPGRETVRISYPRRQGFVLICAYSAVENGVGSFKSYGAQAVVTDNAGSTVTVPLYNKNHFSYWVAIALVDFTDPAGVRIKHVETYGRAMSEARPMLYTNGTFAMSKGPVEFKRGHS